ncbi:hypothetical protein [Vibrio aestuarianus]|uniref:hypothetical protein n=1 Tax=Vibrio aestuarianus TaxID=28171 RepID=UPI00237C8BF8|nr:hypothetical protein [Vibrio aestuarianus]MDE1239829.1 hypothetical protein [Vibrio aestuarianus]
MAFNHAPKYRKDLYISRTAKNKAFEFTPVSQEWQLDIKWVVDMRFIHDSPISKEQKEDLIELLAFRAQHVNKETFNKTRWALEALLENSNDTYTASDFNKGVEQDIPQSYKIQLQQSIKIFIDQGNEFQSQALNSFYLNECSNFSNKPISRKHFDPAKGAHTPVEFDSIIEGVRVLIQTMHKALDKPRPFYSEQNNSSVSLLMGGLMWVLMLSILRRPVQLVQIKMGDFRTNQGDFEGTFDNSAILIDYDELKLQTYRAKTGLPPRSDLDADLHLLNRQNSKLLIKYSTKLFQEQLYRLDEKGITLTQSEKKELFKRYPLFPSYQDLLCSNNFESKEYLFQYLNDNTLAGHVSTSSVQRFSRLVANDILRPIYFSERIPNPTNVTGNNRIRHTILTSMAREGVDVHSLAALTGVTVGTVRCYVDMTPEERIWVDEELGQNAILTNFGKIRIQDQMYKDDDLAFNEYGDVFGSHEESTRCAGCREILPVPLCCYGCDNFNAFVYADHASERHKAMKKYEFNINNGQSENSLKRLAKAIEYIDITIIKCEQHKNQQRELEKVSL